MFDFIPTAPGWITLSVFAAVFVIGFGGLIIGGLYNAIRKK